MLLSSTNSRDGKFEKIPRQWTFNSLLLENVNIQVVNIKKTLQTLLHDLETPDPQIVEGNVQMPYNLLVEDFQKKAILSVKSAIKMCYAARAGSKHF